MDMANQVVASKFDKLRPSMPKSHSQMNLYNKKMSTQ